MKREEIENIIKDLTAMLKSGNHSPTGEKHIKSEINRLTQYLEDK